MLDTNAVLSALLFPGGPLTWLRELWASGRIVPIVCSATARELIEALAYPKFRLDEDQIGETLAAYLPFTETVDLHDDPILDVPLCSDPDDQVFNRLALAGRAEVLVSGDRALLQLARRVSFVIESPASFQKRWVGH